MNQSRTTNTSRSSLVLRVWGVYLLCASLLALTCAGSAFAEPLLEAELAAKRQESAAQVPADARAVMKEAEEDLEKSGLVKQAPKVGDFLPEGSFVDKSGATVSLTAALGEKPAVVTFYRGGWCPYCNIQLRHYQKLLPEIKALGAELVAITPELPDQTLSTQQKNELDFVVLSDRDNAYAKQLKIVFALTPELREVYRQFGIDLERSHGNTAWELPLAATFVVDATRRITYAFVDSDYTKRAEPTALLQAVRRVTRS